MIKLIFMKIPWELLQDLVKSEIIFFLIKNLLFLNSSFRYSSVFDSMLFSLLTVWGQITMVDNPSLKDLNLRFWFIYYNKLSLVFSHNSESIISAYRSSVISTLSSVLPLYMSSIRKPRFFYLNIPPFHSVYVDCNQISLKNFSLKTHFPKP